MKNFSDLLNVHDVLLGPNGCPWDHKQTITSLEPALLEETHEVLEAIDNEDLENIVEELGDLLHVIVFMAKIGEKEGLFSLDQVIEGITQKLRRRHPHIFGNEKVADAEEVVKRWREIKDAEKQGFKDKKKRILETLPKKLPPIACAQAWIQKIGKEKFEQKAFPQVDEEEIGREIFGLILKAEFSGMNASRALTMFLNQLSQTIEK
ncbi:MAG: MazG family protein [Parachlamydiales bacterium]|nr:MazG family protein [Parachlamydiales bacterium]